MINLKEYRSDAQALPDLLNYGFQIEPGIILNKDGSLTKTYSFFGEDANSSTPDELELISAQICRALNLLDSGWMINVDAIRRISDQYPENNYFPDPTSHMIDDERKIQFSKFDSFYESKYYISLTYKPPYIIESKVIDLMFDVEGDDVDGYFSKNKNQTQKHLDFFNATCGEVIEMFKAALNVQELNIDNDSTYCDQLSFLNECILGKYYKLRNPGFGMPADILLGSHELTGGIYPKIEDNFIRIISIDGFPPETMPSVLKILDEYAGEYRWSTRFILMDQFQASMQLENYRKKWQQRVRGFVDQILDRHTGKINNDALDMADDAQQAESELSSGLVKYGFYTVTIVLYRKDKIKADEDAQEIRNIIRRNGFTARIETTNAIEAWLGSLPAHAYPNIVRPPLHTMNLADLLPSTSVWPGQRFNPSKLLPPESPPLFVSNTSGRTPFRVNLHVGDVGHTFIFGPTGAGKSTLLAFLMSQFLRYKNAQVFAFDKDASSYVLTKGVGGSFYDIGGVDDINFAPLSHLDSLDDLTWASEFIELLLNIQGVEVNAKGRKEIYDNILHLKNSNKEHRTLTEFTATIQNREFKSALDQYTIDGAYGKILDATEDNIDIGNFQVFEIAHLMDLSEKILLPVMHYLFRRIDKRLHPDKPTLIVIDEAWLPLSNEFFAAKIDEWLRVLRKKNASVVMASQKIGDMTKSTIAIGIIESCLTKLFLPNPNISSDDVMATYKSLGLNDKQIQIIRNARSKREYYYTSPYGKRLFSLALGKIALAFVGVSQSEMAQVKELEEQFGDDWVSQYLKKIELDDWGNYWLELKKQKIEVEREKDVA